MSETTPDTPETTPVVEQAPTETAPVQTAEEREDAYLMQIDGDDPDIADDDQPTEQVAGEAPKTPDEQPEPESDESSSIDTDELAEAWSVLRRDGFQKDDLGALSDEAVMRLAAHRKKVQTDVDRKLSEATSQKTDDQEQSQESAEEPTTAEATPSATLSEDLLSAAKSFAEHVGLDDDGAQKLAESYNSLLQPMRQQMEQLSQFVAQQQLESARLRLVDRYPQVADKSSDEFARVVERMTKMFQGDANQDMAVLMEDAIAFEFRDQMRGEAESAQQTIRNLRNNGAPSTPTGAQPDSTGLSGEELEDQILALLESDAPDKVDRARRLSGR